MTDTFDTDFVDDSTVDDGGDIDTGGEFSDEGGDPWAWAEGKDPEDVRKTFEKFTTRWQEVLDKEKELSPMVEFANEIQGDPNLQAYLRRYYEQGADDDVKLDAVRGELEQVKNQLAIKEELSDLKKFISDNPGFPEVDQKELLTFAAKGNYPDLQSAYKIMNFDAIRQSTEENTYDKIKETKGAVIPKVGSNDKRDKRGFTESDLASMSDEDFIANYQEIAKSLSRSM